MSKLPVISFRELVRRVERMGFERVRQKGSHIRYAHPDGRKVTIPDHGSEDVPRGLLAKIVRYDLEMSIDDFFRIE